MAWYMTISKHALCGWRQENNGNDEKWACFFLVWHFKLLYRLYSVSFIKVSKIPGFRLNLLRDSVCVAWVFLRERFHGSQILNYFSVIWETRKTCCLVNCWWWGGSRGSFMGDESISRYLEVEKWSLLVPLLALAWAGERWFMLRI